MPFAGQITRGADMVQREVATEYKNCQLNRDMLAEILGKVQLKRPGVDVLIIRCRRATRTVYQAIQENAERWKNTHGRPIRIEIAEDA